MEKRTTETSAGQLSDAIIATARSIVLVLDLEGRILRFNPYMEHLTGRSLAEVQGQDWFATFVPEAKRSEVQALFHRALAGERTRATVMAVMTADGQERRVEWYDAPLTDGDGKLIGLLCTGQDVTERIQVEAALYERTERLAAILDTAADAIITIDQNGLIDGVNCAATKMFGYVEDEMIGRNIAMLMPPPYCDEHNGYIARYRETGETRIIGTGREVVALRRDGTVFPIDLSVSEVDHLGLYLGIVRDITDRKAQHDRLVEAERLAALGEAMTCLAHESRNALARGQSNLRRLARRLKGEEELLNMIDGALRATEDIRRQFETVRDYAAPIHVQGETIDLSTVVNAAWDELASEREGRDAELRWNGTDIDLTCRADPFLLRNAFRNILDNALAACDDPVRIDVGFAETRLGEYPALQVMFRDHGPGLTPEVRRRALDAFFTTKTKGTGVGLAIVKRTVDAHGGEVTLGDGPGAEFVVTLPKG